MSLPRWKCVQRLFSPRVKGTAAAARSDVIRNDKKQVENPPPPPPPPPPPYKIMCGVGEKLSMDVSST